jgi:hypothetical protein
MSIAAFRAEITDNVKALLELNKLKIVLVSGLLAVAFGIGSSTRAGDYSYLTLTLVPFICLYVDYQYYHGLAKIFVLARFLSESVAISDEGRVVQAYELFVDRVRESSAPGLFSFESRAQIGSSALLTLTCPLLGVLAIGTTTASYQSPGGMAMIAALCISALVGAILIFISFRRFKLDIVQMRTIPVPELAKPWRPRFSIRERRSVTGSDA